jgi:hypothetical protein
MVDFDPICGDVSFKAGRDDVVALCLVRDGAFYVDKFIRYHQALGVKHIIFVDTGSNDGTIDIARRHPGVSVFRTSSPFRETHNLIRQEMAKRFGQNHWSLYLDIDERFDYSGSSTILLQSLIRYLNDRRFTAVVAHMVDLFPREPILSLNEKAEEENIYLYHRFYSVAGLNSVPYLWKDENEVSNEAIPTLYSGPRGKAFGIPRLLLTKHPLFLVTDDVQPWKTGSHSMRGARLADFSATLFHVKFNRGFSRLVSWAVSERIYHDDSKDYRAYAVRLRESPGLSLWDDSARELRGVDDLLGTPFVTESADYRALRLQSAQATDAQVANSMASSDSLPTCSAVQRSPFDPQNRDVK